MTETTFSGQRFRRISKISPLSISELDFVLNERLDQWPHMKELIHCYISDWIKDETKYGHYEREAPPFFQNQIFECPDTDLETELQLATIRQSRSGELDDEEPSTSGRQSNENKVSRKHLGAAPLPCYEPIFNWETERSNISGQRTQEVPSTISTSGLNISVKVLSFSIQAGFVEPFYGTICLYHRERREKLSEDFHFEFLPNEFKEGGFSGQHRGIFHLDAPSPSICMLIQLEKHATEEDGGTASVYSRKEPIHVTEREKQKLKVWAQMMPYREPFAWAAVPLFDSSIPGGVGGFGSPSSPLPPALMGSSVIDPGSDMIGRTLSEGRIAQETSGTPVIVEIPGLNRVKENYVEESLQDPKRKVHKPVKATLRLEIERLPLGRLDSEMIAESRRISSGSVEGNENYSDNQTERINVNGSCNGQTKWVTAGPKDFGKTSNSSSSGAEGVCSDFYSMDFRIFTRNEPFTQLLHFLYVYPQVVSFSRKRNVFMRVELRKDDSDIRKPALECSRGDLMASPAVPGASVGCTWSLCRLQYFHPKKNVSQDSPLAIYPRYGRQMLRCSYSQVAINARTANYHDEFKIRLPAILTNQHHLLFTFFHVDLVMKLEAPKPVVIGYAVLPLSMNSQLLRSEVNLPMIRELPPHYLQDNIKERLDYAEDGRMVFKLRLRICSTLYPANDGIRDFFVEYDRHVLQTSPPWGSELLESINNLKNVDSTAMLQFLQPILNMLLQLIGDGGETLQVAAFRAMVNILTRVQQESSDGAERNRFLVQYIDYLFDDFDGRQPPVYPGLCTVWGSLARSKAKGYRVGPVYDDVLSMAWVFLELIVKSMALEQARTYSGSLPLGEDVPPLSLKDGVFRCLGQLYDCLLTEVHERCKKGLGLAKRLNSSLGFFCHDLLSVIDPRQVFELVALYINKFTGICQPSLHECKLTFLQVVCDHDLFVEMPGRDPAERNYLSSTLVHELFMSWDHDDLTQRAKAARILVVLMCKHEFDARYQKVDDKLYIAQLYFPLIGLILDEMPVFYNLSLTQKREVLICFLQIIRNLDDISLTKAWQQSVNRTRLFIKLLEECLILFEYKKVAENMISSTMPTYPPPDVETAFSPKYSDILSPAVHEYLNEASRQDNRVQTENGHVWQRLSPQISSPSQPYSLREALAQAHSSRMGASSRAMRESLHPILRQKLEFWEENLSAAVSLQVLEILEKFSEAASIHSIATDYLKLDCVTAIIMAILSRNQSLAFWREFFPIFNNLFNRHGGTLMVRENDRFLKQVAFYLLRLAVYRNESIHKRAVLGLQILIRNSLYNFQSTARLRVMLTITLSELMSDIQVTQMRSDGQPEESGEVHRLRKSLEELAQESTTLERLAECGMSVTALDAVIEGSRENRWRWTEVKEISQALLRALDAGTEHALLGPLLSIDKYAAAESYHSLAWAYAHVPDLHIMWLLHLCDAHQEMQSWAEAAQCAVAVAGVIMQALVGRNDAVWSKEHVEALRKICPMVSDVLSGEALAAEVEGYGASKLTVDSAVKYLQLANKLFSQAELFHFCAGILELIIPMYKSRHAYGQLAKCHTSLTGIYEAILDQESSPIPFIDATYYRVGFYGECFGKLNKREYVYREARDVRLGDIMEKLSHIYESRMEGNQTLHIIPDSRQVNADELQPGVCYLQITSVDPIMEDEDLESRRERVASHLSASIRARVFDHFLFDTPFTKNGKTQGGLEDQWRRRTVIETEGSFPALVNRLLVIKSQSREFSPIENAIGMIETRTAALRNELEEPRSSDTDQLPRLQSLQRILQGSVAVQVNSGVLGVCTAFLSGEPATRLRSQELQQLIAALLEFMAVCKRAIRVHSKLIGEEDQDFHSQLVNGFQSLTAELSHYIPAILSEL